MKHMNLSGTNCRTNRALQELVDLRAYLARGIRNREDGERYIQLYHRLTDEIRSLEERDELMREIREVAM